MATAQTDKPIETVEELLEKANRAALAIKCQQSTEQSAAAPFIPDMNDDQLRKLAREKLSQALQAIDPVAQPGMTKALCAEVKDRLDGKPVQAINQTSTIAQLVMSVQPDVELLKRIKADLINGLVIDN